MNDALPPGHKVVIAELGDDPLQAIEHHASLEAMAPPDPAGLSPRDVIVAIKSASVGWVDLLMTSGQYQHMPKPPYTPGLAQILRWAEAGQLRPHVSHTFALADFKAAMHAKWNGEVLGGCVLHP